MGTVIMSSAMDCLENCTSLHLPIDVEQIAAHKRYEVHYYSKSRTLIKTLGLTELTETRSAISLRLNDTVHIFLSDTLNVQAAAHALAHEFGHILLGHLWSETPSTPAKQEEEAEEFALYLLAPPPVLEHYRVRTAEEVRARTGLSMEDSRRALRLLEEYRHHRRVSLQLERLKRRAGRHKKHHHVLHRVGLSLLLAAFMLILAACLRRIATTGDGSWSEPTAHGDMYWTDDDICCHLFIDCHALAGECTVYKGCRCIEKPGICLDCYIRYRQSVSAE